jgi:hypothetical protein
MRAAAGRFDQQLAIFDVRSGGALKRVVFVTLTVLLAAISATAQLPPKAKTPLRRVKAVPRILKFKLATGETAHLLFQGDTPLPSESMLVKCRRAGSEIEKEAGGTRFNWAFELIPVTSSINLRSITGVTVDEVSGSKVIPVFSGKPELDDDSLVIFAPGDLISKARYSWLYDKNPTMFIFRITLERAEHTPDVLIQALRIDARQKKAFKQAGYLPKGKKEAPAPVPPKG